MIDDHMVVANNYDDVRYLCKVNKRIYHYDSHDEDYLACHNHHRFHFDDFIVYAEVIERFFYFEKYSEERNVFSSSEIALIEDWALNFSTQLFDTTGGFVCSFYSSANS